MRLSTKRRPFSKTSAASSLRGLQQFTPRTVARLGRYQERYACSQQCACQKPAKCLAVATFHLCPRYNSMPCAPIPCVRFVCWRGFLLLSRHFQKNPALMKGFHFNPAAIRQKREQPVLIGPVDGGMMLGKSF